MLILPREKDLKPNKHGLFTLEQVSVVAAKRHMTTESVDSVFCQVRKSADDEPVVITARQQHLWHPIEIFRACRIAAGKVSYDVPSYAKITNPGGLNEKLVAEIVGADGVNPYWTRSEHAGQWTIPMRSVFEPVPNKAKIYEYRHALRSLADAGMIEMQLGAKRGVGTATFEWTNLAYTMAREDREALDGLSS